MRERHPIDPGGETDLVKRVLLLENLLAEAWDQLWWLSLPWYRRLWYWLPRICWDSQYHKFFWWSGHRSPIRKFYNRCQH